MEDCCLDLISIPAQIRAFDFFFSGEKYRAIQVPLRKAKINVTV